MKKMIVFTAALAASALLMAGCGSDSSSASVDGEASATAAMLPVDASVSLRVGTEENGELILDSSMMEGFFASDHYTKENPYGFALVLTADGKKALRTATRDLAKNQSQITLWADGEAIYSPAVTSMLNTKYVILSIAAVQDAESYDHVVEALGSENVSQANS